jgi:hypothetical protein
MIDTDILGGPPELGVVASLPLAQPPGLSGA